MRMSSDSEILVLAVLLVPVTIRLYLSYQLWQLGRYFYERKYEASADLPLMPDESWAFKTRGEKLKAMFTRYQTKRTG